MWHCVSNKKGKLFPPQECSVFIFLLPDLFSPFPTSHTLLYCVIAIYHLTDVLVPFPISYVSPHPVSNSSSNRPII